MLTVSLLVYLAIVTIFGLLYNSWRKRRIVIKALDALPQLPRYGLFGLMGQVPCLRNRQEAGQSAGGAIISFIQFATLQQPFSDKGAVTLWIGPIPLLILFKPETAEVVLNSYHTISKARQYDFLHAWLGTGLLTSTGDKWKNMRRMLTPAFHFKILEDFIPIMSDNTKILNEIIEDRIRENNGIIDNLADIILMCALDVICETAMGVQMNAQKNPKSGYIEAIHEASIAQIERSINPLHYVDFIYNLSPMGRRHKECLKILHNFTNQVIKKRKAEIIQELKEENQNAPLNENEKKRRPFMDTLIHEHLNNPNIVTEENIREEVDTFMFEGHDTTAWGVTWCLYLIGLYPEIQSKISLELEEIFSGDTNREISMDDLRSMKYLECVIKESQRLYPSVPFYGRTVIQDFNMPVGDREIEIKKGTQIMIIAYLIHRNPDHWPDPETFDPDRFLPMNSKHRHPYSYIPFSAGPRNCIGQKFALLEEKSLIASVLRKFKLTSLDARDKTNVDPAMILRSMAPVRIKVEYR